VVDDLIVADGAVCHCCRLKGGICWSRGDFQFLPPVKRSTVLKCILSLENGEKESSEKDTETKASARK
jgi:hypothetical protein